MGRLSAFCSMASDSDLKPKGSIFSNPGKAVDFWQRRLAGRRYCSEGSIRLTEQGLRQGTLTEDVQFMERRKYCVYNQTRECFLSLGVTAADTPLARLKGLIGKLSVRSDEGIWVVPSNGVHTLGVLVPLDLIYLDEKHRVIHLVEHFPTFRIAPLRADSDSVLELAAHTIYSSQTQVGDQLLICVAEEMEQWLGRTAPQKTGTG
jgi:uncharacterized membrane protein (UPF0127 family)